MLEDMGHPFAAGEPVYDVTFENVQAGLRTDYLFRLANQRGGIVLGTGDLSELALGWCTYGVGDQMSHYDVNAGRAEDADPAPDPLGRQQRPVRRGDGQDARPRSSTPRSARSSCPGEETAVHRVAGSGPTRCRTSRSSTCCATASGRRRSPSSPGTPGTTRTRASGRRASPRPSGWPTTWPRSGAGWRSSAALLRVHPVQALGAAQRAEGVGGRLAVAAGRLAGAVRRLGGGVAAGPRALRRVRG